MRGLTSFLVLICVMALHATAQTQPSQQPVNGDRFVAQALSLLEQHASITAKLRHQSRLHDQTLTGSGNYWQEMRSQGKHVMRWVMLTPIADENASFLQVYDGNHLWTDRRLPSGRQVHRLDVAWLQKRMRNPRGKESKDKFEKLISSVAGQGGLAQMLADLLRNYQFQPPRPTQLNGLPVYALVGHWRPKQLVTHWPAGAQFAEDEAIEWPEQLPHHVLLLVGKNMFPYVCEHRRYADASLANNLAGLHPCADPLIRYEMFEVKFAEDLSNDLFEFIPGDIQWSDETALVLEQLTKSSGQSEQTTISQK